MVVAAALVGLVVWCVLPAQMTPRPTSVGVKDLAAAIVPAAFFVAVATAAIWRSGPRRPGMLCALGVVGDLVVRAAEVGERLGAGDGGSLRRSTGRRGIAVDFGRSRPPMRQMTSPLGREERVD